MRPTTMPPRIARTSLAVAGLLSGCALAAQPAAAQTFTVTFSGTVSYFSNYSPFDSTVAVGTPFTCTFTWDRAIPATQYSADETRWITTDFAHGLYMTVGDSALKPGVNVGDAGSSFIAKGQRTSTKAGGVTVETTSAVATNTTSALSSLTILAERYNPRTSPAVIVSQTDPGADWLYPFVNSDVDLIYNGPKGLGTMTALVTSVSGTGLTPAPEPSQAAALGLGALGLAALAIRAHRRTARPGA